MDLNASGWKIFYLFFLSSLLFSAVGAQNLYLVTFDKKPDTTFDPTLYFDPHGLARQRAQGLPTYDVHDLPVSETYIKCVRDRVDSLRYVLRWSNGVSVSAGREQVEELAKLPFVQKIEALNGVLRPASTFAPIDLRDDTLIDLVRKQLELDALSDHDLDGRGVRIAIFDLGFKNLPDHPILSEVWKNGQILRTRDFYQGDSNVYHHHMHGSQVLACIAGKYEGQNLGAGSKAEFLLARTEHFLFEKPIEEDHWLAAMEWAHKHGADIINSSLGYTRKRYEYEDMDGRTTPVSRAAALAAKKGMLVVSSNGNDADKKWKYLGAPADVPEVLSVGASYPMTPRCLPFSSLGPNAAGRTKPDVAAPGFVAGPGRRGKIDELAGTSFSAPLVAGIAACMIQQKPGRRPHELIEDIRALGHYFPYYDYELGYGILKSSRLFGGDSLSVKPTFDLFYRSDSVILKLDEDIMDDSLAHPFGPVLYLHLESPEGGLTSSLTIPLDNGDRYWFFRRQPQSRGRLRIWFEGYLYEEDWE